MSILEPHARQSQNEQQSAEMLAATGKHKCAKVWAKKLKFEKSASSRRPLSAPWKQRDVTELFGEQLQSSASAERAD